MFVLYPRQVEEDSLESVMPGTEKSRWWDYFKTAMSMIVIPLVLWGVALEVGNAVRDEKIARLESEVAAAKDIEKGVTANSNTLGRVEEKIDATNKRLDDIKGDLRRSLPPAHP